jgi:D-glycero-alpha-D-manno-heptose-7-phosphate kinase
VIASIGRDAARRRALDVLRALARLGRKALLAGDLDEYGRILSANCAQQMALHASLVNDIATGVIDVARSQDACGWKVNGAGGDGGSVTLLCGQSPDARALLARRIEADIPGARVLPLQLSATGVTVRVE